MVDLAFRLNLSFKLLNTQFKILINAGCDPFQFRDTLLD